MDSVWETLKQWDFFDMTITRFGFTKYNRDYQLNVFFEPGGRVEEGRFYSFLFRGCVEAHYECALPLPQPNFMNDTMLDSQKWEAADYPEGYLWSVKYSDAYPGWTYLETSARAAAWSEKLSLSMHEIKIETNVYVLSLVFHDLVVQPLQEDEYTI